MKYNSVRILVEYTLFKKIFFLQKYRKGKWLQSKQGKGHSALIRTASLVHRDEKVHGKDDTCSVAVSITILSNIDTYTISKKEIIMDREYWCNQKSRSNIAHAR
jgi:hypothetical protein